MKSEDFSQNHATVPNPAFLKGCFRGLPSWGCKFEGRKGSFRCMKKRVRRTAEMKWNCAPSVPTPEALYDFPGRRKSYDGILEGVHGTIRHPWEWFLNPGCFGNRESPGKEYSFKEWHMNNVFVEERAFQNRLLCWRTEMRKLFVNIFLPTASLSLLDLRPPKLRSDRPHSKRTSAISASPELDLKKFRVSKFTMKEAPGTP